MIGVLVSVFFISFQVSCVTTRDTEPRCSKFDFEEKLLEKMVKLEHSAGIMMDEFRALKTKVTLDVEIMKRENEDIKNNRGEEQELIRKIVETEIMRHREELSATKECPACNCCPDGWVQYKGSCYLFSTLPKVTAEKAREFCDERESHLVRIETSAENQFVEDYIRQLNGRHFWLDLSDEKNEGTWIWKSNGEPATVLDWDEGEPTPGKGPSENCAAISTNAHDHNRWIDLPCSWNFASPLCEKSLTDE